MYDLSTANPQDSALIDNPEDHAIHLLIDYGTSNLAIAAQIVRKGTDPHPARTRILELQTPGKGEIPQVIGFVREDAQCDFHEVDFKWGYGLLDVLNDDIRSLPEEHFCVVERVKIVMYPDDKTHEVRGEIEKTLKKTGIPNFTTDKLIELHLRHIRVAAMQATVRRYLSTSWSEEQIRAMDVHTFFTVPEVSTEVTIHKLQQLLTAAGFQKTVALTETEAAGAWRSYQLLLENYGLPFRFQGEDELLVADAGGLTLNVSSYQCKGFVESGVRVHIKPVGRNEGSQCGSELITIKFFDYVREYCESHYGGFTSCHESLGYSSEAFLRRLARSFESFKVNFTEEPDRMIRVSNRLISGQDNSEVRFTITKEMMRTWLNAAFEEIVAVIDKVKSERTKVITLTGGFFRSFFLVQKLKERYEPQGIYMPGMAQDGYGKSDPSVVYGGMARSFLMKPRVPNNFCMGVPEDEPYVSKYHQDAKCDPKLIKRCRYTGGRFVENRWRSLLAPGDLAKYDGTFVAEDIWQEYLVSMEDKQLSKQVYVSNVPMQDNENMMTKSEGGWKMRPELQKWGDEIIYELDERTLRQYRKMWPKQGRQTIKRARFLVWARLKIRRDGPNGMDIELFWEIAPPSFRQHTNEDRAFEPPSNGLAVVGSNRLHAADHSSFIQRNGASPLPFEENDSSQTVPAGPDVVHVMSTRPDGDSGPQEKSVSISKKGKGKRQRPIIPQAQTRKRRNVASES